MARIQEYDPISGKIINPDVSSISFGDVVQSHHCSVPILLRLYPTVESSITNLCLYLHSRGNWSGAQFGYYVSNVFVPDIKSGSSVFSHFNSYFNISTTNNVSDFIWLDVDIPENQVGVVEPVFKFSFV